MSIGNNFRDKSEYNTLVFRTYKHYYNYIIIFYKYIGNNIYVYRVCQRHGYL